MALNINLIEDTKRLMLLRYPRFGSEIARANIEYRKNLKYHTAATDGKNIYFDPDYLASLSEDDRLFLVAHELMHIKFDHAFRLLAKDGQKRDFDIWNEATDAIINANLERDGFKIKEGYINRPEALNYSASEFYEILLQEKEKNQSEKDSDQNQSGNSSDQEGQADQDHQETQEQAETEEQHFGDDHSLWEEAFEQKQAQQNEEKGQSQNNDERQESQSTPSTADSAEIDETLEFEENRQERKDRAVENLQRMREELLRKNSSETFNLGHVGEANNAIDWRLLLRREIERSETIWSQNRSIAENNYAYRLEELDIEDEAETEVMIDVSGSVDLALVRAFLRMLKPLLKESKLRVGCFNEQYWGMVEIKSAHDIDNFVIPQNARGHSAWTEDWDLAVRSFTRKNEINKIVFTDGEPCPGTMPKEDLKHENILWLVYGNRNFRPCCGKVIMITEAQLEMMQACQPTNEGTTKEFGRRR